MALEMLLEGMNVSKQSWSVHATLQYNPGLIVLTPERTVLSLCLVFILLCEDMAQA